MQHHPRRRFGIEVAASEPCLATTGLKVGWHRKRGRLPAISRCSRLGCPGRFRTAKDGVSASPWRRKTSLLTPCAPLPKLCDCPHPILTSGVFTDANLRKGNKLMRKKLIVTVATAAALMLVPTAASAAGPDTNFGSHVSQHAQTHGFSGSHNPGVLHQGASGWIPGGHH